MTRYFGIRDDTGVHVAIEAHGDVVPLTHYVRHSPTGYEWGYEGSGPADLARSLLAHHLGGIVPTAAVYQRFKSRVVARLPHDQWTLTIDEVTAALADVLADLGRTCPLCGDQGQLWPEQFPQDRRPTRDTYCSCRAGADVRTLSDGLIAGE